MDNSCINCGEYKGEIKYNLCLRCACDLIKNDEIFNSGYISQAVDREYKHTKKILIFFTIFWFLFNIFLIQNIMMDDIVILCVISISIFYFLFMKTLDFIKNKEDMKINIRKKVLLGGKIGYPSIFGIMDICEEMAKKYKGNIKMYLKKS